jgi:hypothetical protein
VDFKLQKTRVIVEGEVTLMEAGRTLLSLKPGESHFSLEAFGNANGVRVSSRTKFQAIASTQFKIFSSPYKLPSQNPQVII